MMPYVFMVLMLLTSILLILLVLVQRGKGGGLAGAFGGMGGQSAFGTKAGDLFTRVTIGVATFWILLCMAAVWAMGTNKTGPLADDEGAGKNRPPATAPASTGDESGQTPKPTSD